MQEAYSKIIAGAGLDIGAIKLRPNDPFTWASGFRMPIYNDNRMFLNDPVNRSIIRDAFASMLEDYSDFDPDVIAGTSTAGISPATTLGDYLRKPIIYVRDKPKGHGLQNQIEGIDAESDLEGRSVLLIEDLISTGGSSARAVKAIRDANGNCDYCFSIFNYGLDKANDVFEDVAPGCTVDSILNYDILLEAAKEKGYFNGDQIKILEEWREDPSSWGERHGFPKVEK